jgi:hypothetical protein
MPDRAGLPLTIALVVIGILMMSTPARFRPAAAKPITTQTAILR